jgi:hypothetical protein
VTEEKKQSVPVARFLIGLCLLSLGGYLILNAIQITSTMGFGSRMFGFNTGAGQFGVTTGMVMIPFMAGVGVVFYDYKKVWGWLLAGISLAAMIVGVITSIRFVIRPMSSLDFIVILVLIAAGIGMMIAKPQQNKKDQA